MTCAKMPAMDAATRSEEEENNEGEVNLIYHPKMSLNHCRRHSQQEAGGNKINNNIANNTI